MFLPQSAGAATLWAPYDYRQSVATSDPGTADNGELYLELDQVPEGELWLLERIVVHSTSTTDTVATIYLDAVDPSRAVDGTIAGNFDVADESSPIQFPAGSILVCQWTGASAGAVGTLRAQWSVLRQESANQ